MPDAIVAPVPPAASGPLTFLFTDIEGSTRFWEHHHEAMRIAHARHDAIVRQAIEAHGGYVFKMIGDAFCAVFSDALAAVAATVAAQQRLFAANWPVEIGMLKIRAALHTCQVEKRGTDYVSPNLNRIARILSVTNGGQILLSLATTELVRDGLPPEIQLRDLGIRRLKDLIRPENIFQVLAPGLPSDFPPLKTLDNLPNNLPVQLSSFVGREREMAEIRRLLAPASSGGSSGYHLLTLMGVGGTGKTRLILQVAAELLDFYPDGVWLVELASLSDPALIPQTIAQALGLTEQSGRTLLASLTEYLKTRHILLLLDNCEHLVESVADLLNQLLRVCPNLQVLATSRESLNIYGETTFLVPPLGLPEGKRLPPVETLSDYEAVRLFIDRAVAANPKFAVNNQNAPALVQLCRRLDGIPLALELAAARTKVMTVEQINARLNDRFRLLTGGSRTALPRQQTLKALIDWSFELLSESEQVLLRRLSVFAGGWDLTAASQVCADEGLDEFEILDYLSQLVNKSLVVMEEAESAEARYHFLETIRQYGREKLQAAGEEALFQARHFQFFTELGKEAADQLMGREQATWFSRLETEHDNLRAALDWSIQSQDTARLEAGLELAVNLWRFWQTRGYFSEGRDFYDRLAEQARNAGLENTGNYALALMRAAFLDERRGKREEARTLYDTALPILRTLGDEAGLSSGLNSLGNLLVNMGKLEEARPTLEESLEIARRSKDRSRMSFTLMSLGVVAAKQEDYTTARQRLDESLQLSRELDNTGLRANLLNNLGYLSLIQQDYATAQKYLEESLEINRTLGNRHFIGLALSNLGIVAQHRQDYAQARTCHLEGLSVHQELGNQSEIIHCLVGFASLAAREGQFRRAAKILGALENLLKEIKGTLSEVEQVERNFAHATALEKLGEAAFKAEEDAGRLFSLEEALAYVKEAEALPAPEIKPEVSPLKPVEAATAASVPESKVAAQPVGLVATTLQPGTVVGGTYRLERRLGSGAMGEVWLARHILLNEPRAIKLMLGELSQNEVVRQRFIQGEARNALRLDRHPHIVRVYELSLHEQMPYIVMEFVEGHIFGANLREYMQGRGKISPDEVAVIVEQIAAALDHAHRNGLIHRDVKPANILLDGQSAGIHLKLSDFGLVKDTEADVELTGFNRAMGTPLYMAPEQAQGQAEARSDLYSLGVIVYELLAGKPPFTGNTNSLLIQHATTLPAPIEQVNPSISSVLATVVQRALAKQPADRYASAGEFAAAYRQALKDWAASESFETQILDTSETDATQVMPAPTNPPDSAKPES